MKVNKKLAEYIIEMTKVDQRVRKLWFKIKNPELLAGIPNYLVYIIDAVHNYRIRKIIEEYGYPSKRLIGKRALRSFFLLVQHQDLDPELQKTCLEKCDFELRERAYLTDRVLVGSGKRQLYGTQFYRNKKDELVPQPIKDRKQLDKRRKSIGLELFAKHLKDVKKVSEQTKGTQLKT